MDAGVAVARQGSSRPVHRAAQHPMNSHTVQTSGDRNQCGVGAEPAKGYGRSWAQHGEQPMSAADAISKRLKYMRKGRPFSRVVFAQVGSRAAVDKALSRLVQLGCLERLVRGIYMRPKVSKHIGRVRPSPVSVMMAITRANGETIQVHGAEAVRRLGLSTQMQVVSVYYTSGATRDIRVGDAVVRLRHVSSDWLQHTGTNVGTVLTALYYLGKSALSPQVVFKIVTAMSRDDLITLRTCRMPRWMRSAVDEAAASAAALQYAKMLDRAINVFGNQMLAEEWLGRPCKYLDGDVPKDVIDNPVRFQAVEGYLERIEHGVYQ